MVGQVAPDKSGAHPRILWAQRCRQCRSDPDFSVCSRIVWNLVCRIDVPQGTSHESLPPFRGKGRSRATAPAGSLHLRHLYMIWQEDDDLNATGRVVVNIANGEFAFVSAGSLSM